MKTCKLCVCVIIMYESAYAFNYILITLSVSVLFVLTHGNSLPVIGSLQSTSSLFHYFILYLFSFQKSFFFWW